MRARRLSQLDSLRGIAAVVVLLHHNLASAALPDGRVKDMLEASPLRAINHGRAAVLFFFVLSGFVLTRALRGTAALTAGDYVRWAVQRTVRLCLPAAAALTVSAAFYVVAYSGTWPGEAPWISKTVWTSPPTFDSFAAQASLLAPDGGFSLDNVLWSLVHEWRISLFLPFLAAAAAFRGRSGAVLIVLIGVMLGSVAGGVSGDTLGYGPTLIRSLRATLYFVFPFLIGAALERGEVAEMRAGRWNTAAAFVAVLGLGRAGSDYATFLASALLIWLALQPGLIERVLRHPALVWLGTISFSLYLIHVPVLALLANALHDRIPSAAICALSIAAAFPAAQLFYVLAERPAHRLARLVGQPRRLFPAPPLARASG